MNPNGILEKIEMTNGTEGGVLHLLRLTRTQCHAWVAFVALRREDGTLDITAVPGADDEGSEWTLETLEGIVRQTLEDPLIGEGRAVIRVSEVFRRYWPGERQYTRMAVAPLNDVAEPGRPWGLLCALDPVDGQFSEAQLDMLGRLAVRFTNHLRVRRQFMEDAAASDALVAGAVEEVPAPPALPVDRRQPAEEAPEAPAPLAEPLRADIPGAAWPSLVGSAPVAGAAEEPAPETGQEAEVEVVFGGTFAVGAPAEGAERADAIAGFEVPAGFEMPGAETFAAETFATGEPVAEPFAAEAPAAEAAVVEVPVREVVEPEDLGSGATVELEARAEAPAVAAEAAPLRRVRLSELIDQLDATLARLRGAQRHGAFFLVELSNDASTPLAGDEVEAAAERVLQTTRHNDVVLGVGSDMLAVVMELGPRASGLEAIRERLSAACSGEPNGEPALRTTMLPLVPEAVPTGEGLVLQAVRQLSAP